MPPTPEEAPSKVLVKQGGPRRSPGQEFGRSRSAALSEWFFSGSPHLNGFRVRKSVQYEHGLSLPSPGCCRSRSSASVGPRDSLHRISSLFCDMRCICFQGTETQAHL